MNEIRVEGTPFPAEETGNSVAEAPVETLPNFKEEAALKLTYVQDQEYGE